MPRSPIEKYGTVDIEEREASWRKEGWSGYSSDSTVIDTGSAKAGLTGQTARTPATAGASRWQTTGQFRPGPYQVVRGRNTGAGAGELAAGARECRTARR
jgi:hypothetical protein